MIYLGLNRILNQSVEIESVSSERIQDSIETEEEGVTTTADNHEKSATDENTVMDDNDSNEVNTKRLNITDTISDCTIICKTTDCSAVECQTSLENLAVPMTGGDGGVMEQRKRIVIIVIVSASILLCFIIMAFCYLKKVKDLYYVKKKYFRI